MLLAVPLSAGAFSLNPQQRKCASAAITDVTLFFLFFHYFIVHIIYSLFMFFFSVYYYLFSYASDQPSSSTRHALSPDSAHTQIQIFIIRIFILFMFYILNNKQPQLDLSFPLSSRPTSTPNTLWAPKWLYALEDGVPQGSILSVMLFAMAINSVISRARMFRH